MSPKDDGVNEVDTIRTVYTVGPGLRMAIIFVCFALTAGVSFFGGYEFCKRSIIAGDKSNQVEVLKSDTKQGLVLVKEHLQAEHKLIEAREGRIYDKECGDMLISDIIK
jgi:hypothetical protein